MDVLLPSKTKYGAFSKEMTNRVASYKIISRIVMINQENEGSESKVEQMDESEVAVESESESEDQWRD